MIARFLQDIVVNDAEKNMKMTIDKGEELFAIDRGTHYELRKADGWGTMAPKECEGTYYEIVEEQTMRVEVGDKIYVPNEKKPYKVRARDDRYIICTKPYNPQHTVL